ncbi:MAG: hypothetical protein VZQ98_14375 [Bacteroidales bacterium]|nr:hypothetical protein [Bacteroidales bacterium]
MNKGILTQNGVHLANHEYNTVKTLLDNGFDVELIPPSQIKGLHLPDVTINGVPWEIKSPEGKSKNTIKHNLQIAKEQSTNVIIDLARCGLSEEDAINGIEREFRLSKRLRQLKIITKSKEILDFSK